MDQRERLPGRGPAKSNPCENYHPRKQRATAWVEVGGDYRALCEACVRALTAPTYEPPALGSTYWEQRRAEKGRAALRRGKKR